MAIRRLDHALALAGLGSRREAAALARSGAVTVNGVTARAGSQKIDTEGDNVAVRGQLLRLAEHRYLMLHKPAGVISASRDPKTATVLDLVPPALRQRDLFPAGRLDKTSTGLLLVTDDGALAHALLSPRRHVAKTYLVTLREEATEADAAAFAAGMRLPASEGHPPADCGPAALEILPERQTLMVLREGKYHQIRRMFAARGNEVLALHRIAMGPLRLDERLAPGECRELTEGEVTALRNPAEGKPQGNVLPNGLPQSDISDIKNFQHF
ncbi:MAG: rRNA pseudouridine synthase [Oscillospiraceae bacterium]|jgi:16S rRNA pseudouridine516 synthase|nr:rRNA pseudouridine synthase [Oscillospiraceae bacterium]